jgi:hypothetical protein
MRRTALVVLLAAAAAPGSVCAVPAPAWTNVTPHLRLAPLPPRRADTRTGFTLLAPAQTGVTFTNLLRGDLALTNAVAHNGSGVAIGDADGDGWPDLFFCALEGPNRLFRNLGDWRFTELPPGDAACADQLSTGAAFADVDGDGDADLLVNGIAAGTRLFLNDGQGRFTEARETGLSRAASPTSLALADVDGDGDLDLYCTHYIDVMHLADPTTRFALAREGGQWRVTRVNGQPATLPYWRDRFEALPDARVRELPEVDGFYRNEGGGRFTDIIREPGLFQDASGRPVGPFREWGLSVMFRDLNGDGAPDFFVCNDNASPDRLWLNTGRGTFREPPPGTFRHTSRSSMALDFADVDRDGLDDLLVLDMLARDPVRRMRQLMRDRPAPAEVADPRAVPRFNRNMLFLGRPDGTFTEVALWAGVAATDWSWCPIFLDVDLDGFEDLLVSNGFEYDVMDQDSHDQLRQMKLTFEQRKRFRQFHPAWPTPNAALRNRGDGSFEPMAEAWGFNQTGVANGMAVGDLDNDGDPDVVVNNLNAPAALYRNDAAGPRVAVRLRGRAPNTAGIGARLRLTGGPVPQTQEMIAGGRYLSGDQPLRVFAATTAPGQKLELEVRWRSGRVSRVPVPPDSLVEVLEPADPAPEPPQQPPPEPPWFRDLSELLGQGPTPRHEPEAKPTPPDLPQHPDPAEPGVAWFDLDGDGWEDLIGPGVREGGLAIWLNTRGQSFRKAELAPAAGGNLAAVLGWPSAPGDRGLLVATADRAPEAGIGKLVWFSAGGNPGGSLVPRQTLPLGSGVPGPLALGDVDGDGDLDLFAGGRFVSGRYPEPASSTLWLAGPEGWQPAETASQPLRGLGLVNGATFADLDGDGRPELVAATEWGALRVFRFQDGKPEEVTAAWGLEAWTGWWTGVAAGDFDGDGRPDLAAGNRGRNSMADLDRPLAWRLYYGDFDSDGRLEVVEAWRNDGDWRPLRPRPWLARVLPDLVARFPTHEAYGRATVPELLGDRHSTARWVEARCPDSGVFLNRGGRFEFCPLPREAQWAPVFSVGVGDFDGDGHEDLFLAQNDLGGGWDLSREDAGRGLWLRGRGNGTFAAAETGVSLFGEMRGTAVGDFDQDGRPDLAVTRLRGPTALLKNERARPGLRVRLVGPPGNPGAVGTLVRVVYAGGHRGPARVVQAGAGYGSQNGGMLVLGLAEPPGALWIRWPGGREQTVPLTETQQEVSVRAVP